jgi:hypothetical protein
MFYADGEPGVMEKESNDVKLTCSQLEIEIFTSRWFIPAVYVISFNERCIAFLSFKMLQHGIIRCPQGFKKR